jgi:hypothetical protein
MATIAARITEGGAFEGFSISYLCIAFPWLAGKRSNANGRKRKLGLTFAFFSPKVPVEKSLRMEARPCP